MTKTQVIQLSALGGPELMQLVDIELAPPAAGEVLLRQTAIGFNYIDIYQRSGKYLLPTPTGLGHEAAGIIEALGAEVNDLKVGDHVVYMNAGLGAYAKHRNVAANKLVKIPSSISDEQAAAIFFKAMTAQYLVKKTYPLKKGDTALVHAAAGGVGQILSAWAKSLGARVIGTAGSPAKCAIALAAGCEAAIDYSQANWVQQVIEATGGKKAHVVYDSVAQHTFLGSLDCTAPFGMVVLYGAASGPAPEIDPELLNKKGCLFLTRPSVFPHNADAATFRANAADVFEAMTSGAIQATIGAQYKLEDIQQAHRDAQDRKTTGSIVMIP